MLETILVLSPHTDDCELAMGATMANLVRRGKNVVYVCFSICEESVPDGLPFDILKMECLNSTGVIGLKKENVEFNLNTMYAKPSQ